jgi:hypothetical protein
MALRQADDLPDGHERVGRMQLRRRDVEVAQRFFDRDALGDEPVDDRSELCRRRLAFLLAPRPLRPPMAFALKPRPIARRQKIGAPVV